MAGQIQMPSSYVRLTNQPLDISLTFDSLLDARKYAAGIDNTKGTPYNSQIISVSNICGDRNIYGVFRLESSLPTPTIGQFRIVLIEVGRLDTGESITPNNFIIQKDSDGKNWLLVFKQQVTDYAGNMLSDSFDYKMDNDIDLLLSNKNFAFSILGISDIFCNNSNKIVSKIISTSAIDGTTTVTDSSAYVMINEKNQSISQSNDGSYILYLQRYRGNGSYALFDSSSNTNVSYGTGWGLGNFYKASYEIYIDITDYLNRNGVK